tara:strand:- start:44 stop:559 length:516 start_codon:yes stop_codon:yes gene_type:complete
MSLENTLDKIKLLESRASNISDITDSFKKELDIKILLSDYMKVDARSPLEFYVKMILMNYLVDQNPFPLLTEEFKTKAGAPKNNNIDAAKISYYLFNTNGSIRMTSALLQIDRKTVKSRHEYAQDLSKSISSGEFPPEQMETLSRMNDNLFLADFNTDLQRHENNKKKNKL